MPIRPTCRGNSHSAIFVKVKLGESLKYSLKVRGAKPTFALVDQKFGTVVMSDADTPAQVNPDVVYERKWPEPHDQVAVDTNHIMGMHFLDPTTQYTYKVTLHRSDGTQDTILDCDYKGVADDFFYPQLLKVVSLIN